MKIKIFILPVTFRSITFPELSVWNQNAREKTFEGVQFGCFRDGCWSFIRISFGRLAFHQNVLVQTDDRIVKSLHLFFVLEWPCVIVHSLFLTRSLAPLSPVFSPPISVTEFLRLIIRVLDSYNSICKVLRILWSEIEILNDTSGDLQLSSEL